MIDSTNPRSMADNIRKLWDKFSKISGDLLPSRFTATTGQILKLTGETKTPAWADEYSYTPPAYSETETATGQKWIDGKEIYCIVCAGDFETIATQSTITILELTEKINFIKGDNTCITSVGTAYTENVRCRYDPREDNIGLYQVPTAFSEGKYIAIIYYTKPDPTPGRAPEDSDQEPEPEEKKTTKKKTK